MKFSLRANTFSSVDKLKKKTFDCGRTQFEDFFCCRSIYHLSIDWLIFRIHIHAFFTRIDFILCAISLSTQTVRNFYFFIFLNWSQRNEVKRIQSFNEKSTANNFPAKLFLLLPILWILLISCRQLPSLHLKKKNVRNRSAAAARKSFSSSIVFFCASQQMMQKGSHCSDMQAQDEWWRKSERARKREKKWNRLVPFSPCVFDDANCIVWNSAVDS